MQNNTKPDLRNPDGSKINPGYDVDGIIFDDFVHAMWVSVCDDPDADELVFSKPRYADKGFLRCKPLVMSTGEWLCFNYDQMSDRYGYSISQDHGLTWDDAKSSGIVSPSSRFYGNADLRLFSREKAHKSKPFPRENSNCSAYSYVSRTPSGACCSSVTIIRSTGGT